MGFFSFLNGNKKKTEGKPASGGGSKGTTTKKVETKSKRVSKKEKKEMMKYKQGLITKAEMDQSIKPGKDFYRYVNGGWLDNNPVPAEHSRWGTFEICHETALKRLHKIVDEASKSSSATGKKVGDFWKSAMDLDLVEANNLKPVEDFVSEIDAVSDAAGLAKIVAKLHRAGISAFFGAYAMEDLKNSEQMILYFDQGGLGLPDRDFYFEESRADTREKYLEYIQKVFVIAGDEEADAKTHAQVVFDLEKQLAEASLRRKDRRDPLKMYHPESFESIKELYAPFDVETYVKTAGIYDRLMVENKGPINNSSVDFFENGLKKVLSECSMSDIKLYLVFHLLDGAAPYLMSELENAQFDFRGKVLGGQSEMKPRWKRVLQVLNSDFGRGEALGQLYCEKHFDTESKELMKKYIEELRVALRDRINELDWMSKVTKEKAILKLEAFGVKIGFPDKWRSVDNVQITDKNYWKNVAASKEANFDESFALVNGKPDPLLWEMSPQTVNAYFHPSKNEIVFPAAILQEPFFSKNYDPALVFGAIGSVIGHEMTHGFDDQGRKFDHTGNMNDWWTPEDGENFNQKAKVVIDQFNEFEVHGLKVQGELTQGENIADLGGITVSFLALQNFMKKNGRQPDLDGFTPEQRFFISYARAWRHNITEERAKTLVTVDPHSPGKFRVLGPLKNIQFFYDAFDVQEGDEMFVPTDKRVQIW